MVIDSRQPRAEQRELASSPRVHLFGSIRVRYKTEVARERQHGVYVRIKATSMSNEVGAVEILAYSTHWPVYNAPIPISVSQLSACLPTKTVSVECK